MREAWQDNEVNRILLGYGSRAVLLLAGVLIGSGRGWEWLIAISFSGLLILFYFFILSLWATYQRYYVAEQREEQVLWKLGHIRPGDHLVHISLGLRQLSLGLGNHLTNGHLTVIDVYNPQLTPSSALARARQRSGRVQADPRFTWLDGRIELLPLPDNSTQTVIMSHTLTQFWQDGDRQQLLAEIYRILLPGGQLLLVETTRTQTNFLVWGWRSFRLHPAGHWRQLLSQSHFTLKHQEDTLGLLHYFVAQKPLPQNAHQLAFQFVGPTSREIIRF